MAVPLKPELAASLLNASLREKLYVVNRKGEREEVCYDKITTRIAKLASSPTPLHVLIDPPAITKRVISQIHSGISTSELDEVASQTCAYLAPTHPDFSKLAARIAVSNLHKMTHESFSKVSEELYNYVDKIGRPAALLSKEVHEFIQANAAALDAAVVYDRDFEYDYFGFKTLERSYLLRRNGAIAERPQHMLMRVSCGIHTGNIERSIETYNLMSQKFFTHATPTLFNSGTPRPQMSSCFLLAMKNDSIEGIFDTLKRCAQISKCAGGIGLSTHCIRATGSYIRGSNGKSNGLVPMLRVFNAAARYVDQGGGKRKGSFAIYLEPWHADVFDWLDLKKNHGKEENRARDLFYAVWVPDLFMRRVEQDGEWTLMCPNECPGLEDVWGEEFDKLYEKYEAEGRGAKKIQAQKLWFAILQSQIETGTPYMLYKDSCNRKSNQQNLGTIKSSNLCTEIVEFTSADEVAVCNLASLALPRFVDREANKFDFAKLHHVTKVATFNLNRVIDRNFYPMEEARRSNMRHRPVGLGVQGLADAFMLLRLPFESEAAKRLNKDIFETIYHAAIEASCECAKEEGAYETYPGSPASKGQLQFDMWGIKPDSGLWDWEKTKADVAQYGLRNSLLVAPMPTASTSQILGNNESIEPYTSNLYARRVLSGEFVVVNPHLLCDLLAIGMWNDRVKHQLIAANGSVQNIEGIPAELKELYKTVWEISQKTILQMAADRGAYIDQSQSLNIHMANATYGKLSSMHFYGWRAGLKTGMYYLRTQGAADPIKFTVDTEALKGQAAAAATSNSTTADSESAAGAPVCKFRPKHLREDDECLMCGS